MIQDIGNSRFDNSFKNLPAKDDDYVFIFEGTGRRDDKALIKADNIIEVPRVNELAVDRDALIYLFSIDTTSFYLCMSYCGMLPGGYSFNPIRTFRRNNPGEICFAGMTAYHLFTWYRDNTHCGRCGEMVVHEKNIRALYCPACGNLIFPKICPAVIVGLKHGNRLLMSVYANREYKGRALLAGFCEIGETPEETVRREVFEEVGLRVKNIKYFGSQPWGFDSNLLLGYYADLDGDENITLDEEELAKARFYEREEIEYEPLRISLTATMIEAFRNGEVQ